MRSRYTAAHVRAFSLRSSRDTRTPYVDELELDLQGLTLLEMDYTEFDNFVADLDANRRRKRPHELTDCWTDRRRAWLAGGGRSISVAGEAVRK